MPAPPPRSQTISRRLVVGAAAAVPALPLIGDSPTAGVVTECADWLAIDIDMERLTLRWAELDAATMRESASRLSSSKGRNSRAMSSRMAALDQRLNVLGDEREHRLHRIAKLRARDAHAVAGKLAVAARMLDGEGGPIHQIVAEAVDVLGGQRCSGCGVPFVPGALRPIERL